MPSDLVVRIKAETSGLVNGIRKAQSSIAGLEKQNTRTATSFSRMAKIAAGSTAALGVAKLIKSSVDLEAAYSKTMAQVAVATNAPKSQLKALDELAMKMGADTVFSAQDAAGAMLELSKGGLSVAQIQAGALADTLTLASAGGLELGDAAGTVVNAMGAFQISAKDTNVAVAALAGAANASSSDVSDITQALAQAGTSAHSAGLSIQETTAYLALFSNQGIKGSDAGTSLRTMLTRLVPQTKQASNAMDALKLSYTDGNGKLVDATEIARRTQKAFKDLSDEDRIRYANATFGADAQRAVNAITTEGASGLQKYLKSTKDLSQAQKLAKAANSGTAGAMEQLRGTIETAQIQIGKGLAPVIRDVADNISGIVADGDFEKWAHDGAQGAVDFAREMQPLAESLIEVGKSALPAVATAAHTTADALQVAADIVKPFVDAFNKLPDSAQKALILAAGVKSLNNRLSNTGGLADPAGISLFGFGQKAEKAGQKAKRAGGRVDTLGGSLKSFGILTAAGLLAPKAIEDLDRISDALKGTPVAGGGLLDSFNRNGKATAKTMDEISAAISDSDIGKYASDLGIDVDRLAESLAESGSKGEYVQEVMAQFKDSFKAPGTKFGTWLPFLETDSEHATNLRNALEDLGIELDDAHDKASRAGEDMNNLAIDMLFADGKAGGLNVRLKALPAEVKTAVLTPGALDSDKKITTLARKYKLTPKQVRTVLEARGTAESDIKRILKLLDKTDKSHPKPKVDAETSDAERKFRELYNLLHGLRNKTIYVNVKKGVSVNPGDAGGGTQLKNAEGGAISGPGTGTSDSIPSLLSNGEHVITAREVRAAGGQRAIYAMRRAILNGGNGYATGGAVGGSSPSSSSIPSVVSVRLKGAKVAADKHGMLQFVDGRVEVALASRDSKTRVNSYM